MSEVSREEAIKRLKCRVRKCFAICTTCEYRTKTNIMIPSIEQAISDMEKLQKIEETFKDISCEEDLYYKEKECGCYETLLDIFKILRGE